jgi:hypothetical protein
MRVVRSEDVIKNQCIRDWPRIGERYWKCDEHYAKLFEVIALAGSVFDNQPQMIILREATEDRVVFKDTLYMTEETFFSTIEDPQGRYRFRFVKEDNKEKEEE